MDALHLKWVLVRKTGQISHGAVVPILASVQALPSHLRGLTHSCVFGIAVRAFRSMQSKKTQQTSSLLAPHKRNLKTQVHEWVPLV